MGETRSRKARNARSVAKAMLNRPSLPLNEDLDELPKFLARHTDMTATEVALLRKVVNSCNLWLQEPKTLEAKLVHSKKCLECTTRLAEPA